MGVSQGKIVEGREFFIVVFFMRVGAEGHREGERTRKTIVCSEECHHLKGGGICVTNEATSLVENPGLVNLSLNILCKSIALHRSPQISGNGKMNNTSRTDQTSLFYLGGFKISISSG